ncbi:hypothetical protein [Lederbergia graminis]
MEKRNTDELKAKLLLEVIQDSLALFYKKYILQHQRIVGNFKLDRFIQ